MQSIAIRTANPSDLESIVPLFDRYRQFYGQPSNEAAARAFLRSRLENQDSLLLMAEAESLAIGFSQLYPSFSSVSMGRIFILNDLFVAPEARRSGVGRALLAAAAQQARELGALRLSLSTAITNTAAQALYEGSGWQREEHFHVYNLAIEP